MQYNTAQKCKGNKHCSFYRYNVQHLQKITPHVTQTSKAGKEKYPWMLVSEMSEIRSFKARSSKHIAKNLPPRYFSKLTGPWYH